MEITPPYGYQEVVALAKEHHVVLPAAGTLPPVFHSMMVIPLSYSEFSIASHDYPVVFVSGDQGKSVAAMAVLGLEQQQNLFVAPGPSWDNNVYLPAYVRRYPFCMTRVNVGGTEQADRIACVEKRAISAGGDALHDAKGDATPIWEALRKFLFEFETDLARTEAMCRMIVELGLLEPFTMQATPNQGEPLSMTGMFRVQEQKLAELSADKLKELAQNGVLPRLYAHLMSMSNFNRLLLRRAARMQPPRNAGA
jgi:SapC